MNEVASLQMKLNTHVEYSVCPVRKCSQTVLKSKLRFRYNACIVARTLSTAQKTDGTDRPHRALGLQNSAIQLSPLTRQLSNLHPHSGCPSETPHKSIAHRPDDRPAAGKIQILNKTGGSAVTPNFAPRPLGPPDPVSAPTPTPLRARPPPLSTLSHP